MPNPPINGKEKWLPMPGYDGLYQVSDQGRFWSERKQQLLKPWESKSAHHKYLRVEFSRNGDVVRWYAHAAVLTAHVGPRPGREYEALHYNGDTFDNDLQNLRWGTKEANAADRARLREEREAAAVPF